MSERESLRTALFGCACLAAVIAAAVLLAGCDAGVTAGPTDPAPIVGPAGPPGPRGAIGPACAPAALATYQVDAFVRAVSVDDPTTARAFCELGDIVLGGGCEWGDETERYMLPLSSTPILGLDREPTAQGWECRGYGDGETVGVTAIALCLEAQ